jgi:hypothetical protein
MHGKCFENEGAGATAAAAAAAAAGLGWGAKGGKKFVMNNDT